MFELGAAAKLDLYQAKVNLGNDKISLLNQQNLVDDAKRALNLAMAREPGSDIKIQLLEDLQYQDFSLDEMYDTAMDNRPLIKMGEASIKSSEYSVLRSEANYLPRLSFFYNYNRSNSDFEKVYSDFDLNWGSNYGLSLSMNLFNGFEDYLNVQNAKINESQTRETHAENIRNLKSRIRGYYENYNSYIEIIEINKENLEAANEELRLAEERYQIGAGTSLEVREAQVKLTRAEQTLIAAQYNALITEAQLDNELGITAKNLDE
jgi:outer membrane protein TolC